MEKGGPPCHEHWIGMIEELYIMEKWTYLLRPHQDGDQKYGKNLEKLDRIKGLIVE